MAGEASCVWSVWYRARHQLAKVTTDFDFGRWQVDHTAIIRRIVAEFEGQDGYAVTVERQNQFSLAGKVGILAGRPDVVAVRGNEGVVIDAKTGQPRPSDRVQVLLYMWALPRANPAAFGGVTFRGRVEYGGGQFHLIEAEEVDAAFSAHVSELMRAVCGPTEPSKAPSYAECRCCPLTPADCPDRVDREESFVGTTDEF
jgi:hypothetical protein